MGFGKSAAACVITNVAVPKIGDKKLKEPACSLLTALAEATSPSFVAGRVSGLLAGGKLKALPVRDVGGTGGGRQRGGTMLRLSTSPVPCLVHPIHPIHFALA